MDDSGIIFYPTLICSICYKSMEGTERKSCAYGKPFISTRVSEKNPLPSVSHPGPGTTLNKLPVHLCRDTHPKHGVKGWEI